jgi:hypothetical protein
MIPIFAIPAAVVVVGCRDNPAIDKNASPLAVAWIDDDDFPIPRDAECEEKRKKEKSDEPCPVDEVARRTGVTLPFSGSPVTVTLDGTLSSDRDGNVAGFRWLSANFGPGCEGRDTDPKHDPKDTAKPKVTLGEGFWEFALWVEDDAGATSQQSVVTVRVGDSPASDDPCPNGPAGSEPMGDGNDGGAADGGGGGGLAGQLMCVMECAAADCPALAADCDAEPMCWPLLGCVAEKCADLGTDLMAIQGCAVAMCVEFLPGAAPAVAAAECALMCRDGECAM